MLQVYGSYTEFPFYGQCNTKAADNAITLSGDIRQETLPNGNVRVGIWTCLLEELPAASSHASTHISRPCHISLLAS